MERLTKRIASHVYYTQGKYEETIPAEMETNDIRSVLKKLAEYEDLEEQGLLLRLPVAEGSTVWELKWMYDCKCGYECQEEESYKCEIDVPCEHEFKVWSVAERKFNIKMLPFVGEIIFLTRTEAEQALERMEKENG